MQNKNTTKISLTLAALAALVVVGCAKDRNYQDFRQQVADENLAKMSTANGTYSGVVLSKLDADSQNPPSVLGTMDLKLQATADVQKSQDNLGTEQTAVMQGSMTYHRPGNPDSTVTFNDGSYDPSSNLLTVDIMVPDEETPSVSQEIEISGKIKSGVCVCDVSMPNYPDYGGKITLSVNGGATQSAVNTKAARFIQLDGDKNVYQGQYTFEGQTYTAIMKIQPPASNPQQSFLRFLDPQRIVNITIDLGEGFAPLSFQSNAVVNDKTNSLTGTTTFVDGTTSYVESLSCSRQAIASNAPLALVAAQAWNCTVQASTHTVSITFAAASSNLLKIVQ